MAIKPKTLRAKAVLQFRITLVGISPAIWRRVVVPERYDFWELHVAIQDSMGWLDYHLHEFRVWDWMNQKDANIPVIDDVDESEDWGLPISQFFVNPGDIATYAYDFGDGWQHEILLEGILLAEKKTKYPVCTDGARACPPEDCGGVHGYTRLLEILKDQADPEHEMMNEWLKGHAKNYYPFDPKDFDPKKVKFSNPEKRWNRTFPDSP